MSLTGVYELCERVWGGLLRQLSEVLALTAAPAAGAPPVPVER